MNIGIDIRCLMDKNRTGVGEYAAGLLEAIFKIDREDQFFLFFNSSKDVSANLPKWRQENVHYVGTRYPNKLLNLLLFLKVLKLDKLILKKQKSKKAKKQFVNETMEQWNNIEIWFSPNLNFTHLSKNVKHVLTIHDLSFKFFSECFIWKQRLWHMCLNPRRQCQRADVIITPSENTKRDVANSYQTADSRIQVLRPGFSGDMMHNADSMGQVREKYNLPDKYILFLGTLEPRKNVETIVKAYYQSSIFNLQSFNLVLAGAPGWKNKKLMELIKNTAGVKYLGYVDVEDKPALYSGASLFVFPSLYEGFGIPVLEAMACGTPVITANRSSLPEVGQDAVYYVNPHNVSELAEAIEMLLKNEDLRLKIIGRQMEVAKMFEWGKTAEKFLEILKDG